MPIVIQPASSNLFATPRSPVDNRTISLIHNSLRFPIRGGTTNKTCAAPFRRVNSQSFPEFRPLSPIYRSLVSMVKSGSPA